MSANRKDLAVWPNRENLCLWKFLLLTPKKNPANNTVNDKKNNEFTTRIIIFIIESFLYLNNFSES